MIDPRSNSRPSRTADYLEWMGTEYGCMALQILFAELVDEDTPPIVREGAVEGIAAALTLALQALAHHCVHDPSPGVRLAVSDALDDLAKVSEELRLILSPDTQQETP